MAKSLLTLPADGEDVVTYTDASGDHQQVVVLVLQDGTLVPGDGTNGLKVQLGAALPAGSASIGTVVLGAGTAEIGKLAAGTAEIGKLGASTANIGDVDVLTLPALAAGTAEIGKVEISDGTTQAEVTATGTHKALYSALVDTDGDPLGLTPPGELTASPTIYSAGAIAQYDSLHTAVMTFAQAANSNGGTGRILGARLVCKHNTFTGTIALHLFRKSVSGTTAGDTLAVSDTDRLECIGTLTFDFSAFPPQGGGRVATADRSVLPLDYKCDAGVDDLFGILQTTGTDTDTFAAADLVPFLSFVAD